MNLHQKLVEVRKTVQFLKKENEGFQFSYVSSSQALGALRQGMDEQGVALIPSVLWTNLKDHVTKKGEHQYFTEIWMEFAWVNAEKPEDQLVCHWYSQGIDDGEKGPGKAYTYAEKYFLLKFFNIATDKDDPDAQQEQPKKASAKPQEKQVAKAAAEPQQPAATEGNGKHQLTSQQKKIFAMTKEAGMSREFMKEHIAERYGKESSNDLTTQEASEIIDFLQGLIDLETERDS